MPLSQAAAKDLIEELIQIRQEDMAGLELYHDYLRGFQSHPSSSDWNGMPAEVTKFVQLSRINIVDLVVEVMAQSLYVDGYRPNVPDANAIEESAGWLVWQANRMDSRQAAVHRGAFTYGIAYAMVLPGDPVPVIRGYSPRKLTVVYGDDPDWPYAAMLTEENGQYWTHTLYDAEASYTFTTEGGLSHVTTQEYEESTGGVCPVVRFLNIEDLDDETLSEVERLIPIQDQVDVTTFGLIVAQHYQAFLQRYVVGWEAKSEVEYLKANASRLWTFDDPDVKVGQFQQAQLDGYLRSREDTVQLGAVISQTPPHHLLGELINLSAEALAAAEAGHRRKITMRQVTLGESWEQVLALAELQLGVSEAEVTAQVRWKDTEARSLAQTVDALGKISQMLGVPAEALWERIPGVTQQDLQLFRSLASQADALTQLTGILDSQLAPAPPPAPAPAPQG